MTFEHRELAVVAYERTDEERCLTHYVGMKGPSGGWGQGFGGLAFDEPHLVSWKEEICKLFGVTDIAEIVGRQCFILRNWASWGHDIEGLEVDGKRFTITGFRRKHWPDKTKTQLENAAERLRSDIRFHARRIDEDVARLERLHEGYVEWSEAVEPCPAQASASDRESREK